MVANNFIAISTVLLSRLHASHCSGFMLCFVPLPSRSGCDKNMPGTLIAMARLNRPALMIYGGTIKPGYSKLNNNTLDIVSAFQSYGEPPSNQATTSPDENILHFTTDPAKE